MRGIYFPINEIFLSVQGEGRNSGKIALFIRFGKCNLRCKWCDAKETWKKYKFMSVTDIKKILQENRRYTNFIIFTGGEPGLQDLTPLIKECKALNYIIGLETNGILFKEWMKLIDWITVSPKTEINKRVLKFSNELKFVITGEEDFLLVEKFLSFSPIYLMPVNNKKRIAQLIINYLKKSNYKENLYLGCQIHKVYKIK